MYSIVLYCDIDLKIKVVENNVTLYVRVSLLVMVASTKRKRILCTIEQKMNFLQWLDKGESITKLACEMGVITIIKGWKKKPKRSLP